MPIAIHRLSFSSAVFRMPQIVEVVKFCCHCAVTVSLAQYKPPLTFSRFVAGTTRQQFDDSGGHVRLKSGAGARCPWWACFPPRLPASRVMPGSSPHDRTARADQAIKDRGFAHVGLANDGKQRDSGFCRRFAPSLVPRKRKRAAFNRLRGSGQQWLLFSKIYDKRGQFSHASPRSGNKIRCKKKTST